MGICTAEELVEVRRRNPNAAVIAGGRQIPGGELNLEAAEKVLKDAFNDCLQRRQPEKGNRPWQLINLSEKLDARQNWLGFEWEMGLNSADHYKALVTYLWHEHNHVTIDLEGNGAHSAEVTFPPEDANRFREGESSIQRALRWMNERDIGVLAEGYRTGTHLNVSTPTVRRDGVAASKASALINRSMWSMPNNKHVELFGRLPYGMSRPRQSGTSHYLEFKLFASTGDAARFQRYVDVSIRMGDLVEWAAQQQVDARAFSYIENFDRYLHGLVGLADVRVRVAPRRVAEELQGNGFGWRYRSGLGPALI